MWFQINHCKFRQLRKMNNLFFFNFNYHFDLVIPVTKMDSLPVEIVDMILRFAARSSHMKIVCARVCKFWYVIVSDAADQTIGLRYEKEMACVYAAKHNHMNILQWLFHEGYEWCKTNSHKVVKRCDLQTLRWLCIHKMLDAQAANFAARLGKLAIVEYLCDNYFVDNEEVYTAAAEGGHLEVLQYLSTKKSFMPDYVMDTAAANGHIHIVQWLAEVVKTKYSKATFSTAVSHGQLQMVKYLQERGCPSYSDMCEAAALRGDLKMLQYLRSQGCAWDHEVCAIATRRNRLVLLQWAVANGCPWVPELCLNLAKREDIRDWIRAQIDANKYKN
jgi:hypothetical protein